MGSTRTENSIRNVKTGFIVQLINKIMAFVVRTIFIKCLNTDYLGINGLFTNVLSLLSFAELGIGTAIIYNLYKPVAENNVEKIKSLMKLYKKAYFIIGIVIFIMGICLIPFMNLIVGTTIDIKENIIFIYLLFLFDTSSSYFFTYKKSIIIANQKQSIINNFDSFFYLIKSLLQILILIYTKNYIIYLIMQILSTFFENILISKKANKLYPYLCNNDSKDISNEEKKSVFNNVKSLAIYQFGSVIMNGTDNILISYLINVTTVGLVSNYTLIINSIKSILNTALNGITASIGNLNVTSTQDNKESIFRQLTFVYYLIYSCCSIAFVCLLNPFISLWLGNDYLMTLTISISLSVSFFIEGIRMPSFTYRTTLGLFNKSRVTPYIGALINLVFSVILCKIFGLVGIFLATSLAQLMSYSWIDPYIIYKYEFKSSVLKFYKKYLGYFITFFIEIICCVWICNFININNILDFFIKCIIVLVIPNILNLFLYYKSDEYKALNVRLKLMIKKQFNK